MTAMAQVTFISNELQVLEPAECDKLELIDSEELFTYFYFENNYQNIEVVNKYMHEIYTVVNFKEHEDGLSFGTETKDGEYCTFFMSTVKSSITLIMGDSDTMFLFIIQSTNHHANTHNR